MGLDQIVPAIALIAVLILVLPNFLKSNSEKKQLFKNLLIWSIIILFVVVFVFLLFSFAIPAEAIVFRTEGSYFACLPHKTPEEGMALAQGRHTR